MNDPGYQVFFHKAMALYKPGDEIRPGNYGRVVLGAGAGHSSFFREQILESIRLTEFADKPSRLSSAFFFSSRDTAEAFQPDAFPNLYSVRLADPSMPVHAVDMTWLDRLRLCHTMEGVKTCARRYWSGTVLRPLSVENLTTSPLVVVARLTEFEDERL